jgi:TetR/AcrR family transcriptional repressor of nem operon
MGRTIEFDYDKAIDKATLLFWKKGYTNASLRELLKVMGIGEGSFYNKVKSKEALYLECLKHYNATVSKRRLDALMSGATAGEGVRAFFKTVLDELDDPKTPSLCLLAGSLSGDVLAERDLRKYVLDEIGAFVGAFEQRLESAKETGELPHSFEPKVAAQTIVTYLQGLFRVFKILQTRAQIEQQIDALLRGLGL